MNSRKHLQSQCSDNKQNRFKPVPLNIPKKYSHLPTRNLFASIFLLLESSSSSSSKFHRHRPANLPNKTPFLRCINQHSPTYNTSGISNCFISRSLTRVPRKNTEARNRWSCAPRESPRFESAPFSIRRKNNAASPRSTTMHGVTEIAREPSRFETQLSAWRRLYFHEAARRSACRISSLRNNYYLSAGHYISQARPLTLRRPPRIQLISGIYRAADFPFCSARSPRTGGKRPASGRPLRVNNKFPTNNKSARLTGLHASLNSSGGIASLCPTLRTAAMTRTSDFSWNIVVSASI